jgi:uncharacterized protein
VDLTLVLTHACNLGCGYCYAGAKDARAMPEPVARRALAWAMPRCGGELLVGYFGGEPLIRWDLLTSYHAMAVELAATHGVKLTHTVTTNATLLTPERMDWLCGRGFSVGVSIDGTRTAHERMRPRAGGGSSYEAVLAGLRVALLRRPMTQTISVVHPDTVGELAAGVDALLAEGVRVLSLSLDPSAAWDLGSLETARQQMELVGERWLAEYRAGRDLWIEPLDGRIVSRIKGGLQACDQCSAGLGELAVAPSGQWYPCERMVGADGPTERRWSLGSVLDTADGGPDAQRVRELSWQHQAEPASCQTCPLRSRCQHHCACSNAMASGQVATPGGAQCAWEQSAIATADRVGEAMWAEGNALFLKRRYRLTA